MPPKKQSSKRHPPGATESTPPTRRMATRSANKGAEPATAEAGSQKRKAEDLPHADQPAKRSDRKAPGVKLAHHATNTTKEATEPMQRVSSRTTEQGLPPKLKTGIRKAPARPTPSSDSEDEEEDTANHTTDGGATSPLPSDDEADEFPTAIQLAEEHPIGVRVRVTAGQVVEHQGEDSTDNDYCDHEIAAVKPIARGGRRAHRVIKEVPAPGPLFQQPDNSLADMPDPGTTTVARPPTNLLPNHGNVGLTQPIPAWPASTDLIQEDNGSYKQTSQTTEISNCLSAAVKRANSNLLLINSFPDVDQQERWLVDALKLELSTRTCGHVIRAVGERARADINYFYCLLSMIRNRWSGYRQSVLKVARALVGSPHPNKKLSEKAQAKMNAKTSYKLLGSDAEKAEIAARLLHQDTFHFGTTKAGAPDGTAPYQRQEMLFILAYFFRCDNSLEGQVPTGECGQEIPKPMVALAATLIEVALREIAEGERVKFSEEKQKDRYSGHLNSFERVRVSKNGGRKLARLLSDIYNATMNELSSKGSSDVPVSGVSTGPSLMDTDNMRV